MPQLILYFNELCFRNRAPTADVETWTQVIQAFVSVVSNIVSLRGKCKVAFTEAVWELGVDDMPLREQFRQRITRRDAYRQLLANVKVLADTDLVLDSEIRFQGCSATGLTLAAHIADVFGNGWAISFPFVECWDCYEILAEKYILTGSGVVNGPIACSLGHLANEPHVRYWETYIQDWGAAVAASCQLDVIEGHPVVMYPGPKEHGPPHVHLLESAESHRTLAKYRVDVFERPLGAPNWDAEMSQWVERYRDQLLRSWMRCQRGGHPYKLEEPVV